MLRMPQDLISSTSTTSLTTMFSKIALFSAFVGLVAAKALDVYAPPITSPTAASVWPIGSVQNVTWYVFPHVSVGGTALTWRSRSGIRRTRLLKSRTPMARLSLSRTDFSTSVSSSRCIGFKTHLIHGF